VAVGVAAEEEAGLAESWQNHQLAVVGVAAVVESWQIPCFVGHPEEIEFAAEAALALAEAVAD